MNCLIFSGKLLKILIPRFCAMDRFIGGCKLKQCLLLILCIAEFDLRAFVFLTTNIQIYACVFQVDSFPQIG